MLITRFPDIHWLRKQIRENFSDRKAIDDIPLKHSGWPTVILNVSCKSAERKDIKGPFSLFINRSGSSTVDIAKRSFVINEQCFIASNFGQHYGLLIDGKSPTETLNIHFGEKFFFESVHALTRSHDSLLDAPMETPDKAVNFPVRSIPRSEEFNDALNQVLHAYSATPDDDPLQEEKLFGLLYRVLTENHGEIRQIQHLPVKSLTVKKELQKRLFIARDFIHARFHEKLSLDELSRVCCLSKFHFLRMFKQAFQLTPYQYQKRLRVERSIDLLINSRSTLDEIAWKVGLENASSLSRMIYQHAGLYPAAMREGKK